MVPMTTGTPDSVTLILCSIISTLIPDGSGAVVTGGGVVAGGVIVTVVVIVVGGGVVTGGVIVTVVVVVTGGGVVTGGVIVTVVVVVTGGGVVTGGVVVVVPRRQALPSTRLKTRMEAAPMISHFLVIIFPLITRQSKSNNKAIADLFNSLHPPSNG